MIMTSDSKHEKAKAQNSARQKRHQEKLKASGLVRAWVPLVEVEAAPKLKPISEGDRHALKVGREAMAATGIKRTLLGWLLSL